MSKSIMIRIADTVIKRDKLILFTAMVLVALSVISAGNIRVTTEMKDLLPDDDPQVRRMNEIDEYFSGGTSVFITVEGDDKEEMTACAEAFVEEIKSRADMLRYIRAINLKLDKDFITQWGFLLQEADDLADSGKMFAQVNLAPFLTALNDSFEETYIENSEDELSTAKQENDAVAMFGRLETFFTLLREYLANPECAPLPEQGEKLAEAFIFGDLYSFSPDNSMLMFSLAPNFSIDDIEAAVKFMDAVREVKNKVQRDYPNLRIGYTGDIAMQADEQYALRLDMLLPSLVALGTILILFLFSLRPLRAVFFALLALIVGIVVNYGLIGITFKEINILTSTLGALLIGLGIDYGIQMVTNFGLYRTEGHNPADALRLTYAKAGTGTLLAALTTAVAFFVMGLTGSQALSQFGVIAGMGILACFLAMFLVLPALLYRFAQKPLSRSRLPVADYGFLVRWGRFMYKHRVAVLIIGGFLSGVFLYAMFLNRLELDLIKLEPQGMPSIKGYYKVMEKFGLSPMPAMAAIDTLEEARELTKALEGENFISQIESLANYIPAPEDQRARLAEIGKIRGMGPRYGRIAYTEEELKRFAGEVQRLEWNLIEIGDLSVAGLGEKNKIVRKRDDMIREILGAETGKPGKEVFQRLISLLEEEPSLYAGRLTQIDAHFAEAMDRMISKMAEVERPITVADLPASVRERLLSAGGERNLIVAYPRQSIMKSENGMRRFAERMAAISPRITGLAQIMVSWLEDVIDGTTKAAVYIFAVVFLFLLLTFRNLRSSLLAMAPLLAGIIWMLGLYPLLGWRINLINIALIPLVIGMGIDFGIHIVHRYKVEREIEPVFRYTGKAVLLSALTTMIGFGSLGLIGSFEAVASVGAVLFLGISACLLTALTLLPALLGLGEKAAERRMTVPTNIDEKEKI